MLDENVQIIQKLLLSADGFFFNPLEIQWKLMAAWKECIFS